MNDQQLEAVLRRSLARHAATIESGPQWPLPDEDLLGPAPRRGGPWWPIAATVAAVLVLAGIVVAVRHLSSDRDRPATPVIVTRSACTIDPPPAWQQAIEAAQRRNLGQPVLGGAPDGTILVRREGDATVQTVLVSPSGATRIVQQMPFPGRYGVATNSMIDSRWIVLPIGDIRADVPTLLDFDVFDRATLQLTEKVPITKGSRIGTWALFNGHLYWTQPRSGSIGSLFDHDLAARTTRTAEPYGVQNLLASPNGVAWTDAQHRTHLLGGAAPDQIPGQPGTHPGLVTDGRSYAWPSGSSITWHNTATKQTVMVRWFPRFQVTVVAVAGPYVLINSEYNQNRSSRLIDTRTGAAASSPGAGPATSGNGVLALSDNPVVVLHVDQLPPLTC
jgi:hypothetical protein